MNNTGTQLRASLLSPRGSLTRLCEQLAAASPSVKLDTVYSEGARLALRLLFLRLASYHGLLADDAGALEPTHATWGGVERLLTGVARGELAPGTFARGGLLDGEGTQRLLCDLSDRILRDLLADLGPLTRGAGPVRLLGDLHEELAGRRLTGEGGRLRLTRGVGRGAAGVYYTPEPVVDELVWATVGRTLEERGRRADPLDIRVCDPAMGSGHFLLSAARCIARHAERGGRGAVSTRELLRAVAEGCLLGVDLSAEATDLARLSLWLTCSEPGSPLMLPEGRLWAAESLLGVDWAGDHPGGFDVVLGNPPWGARLAGDREALRRAYQAAVGELESASLFTELALRICAPGGRVGLVTPNTWLTLVRQEGLRRAVAAAGQVELLREHPPGTFAAARSIVPLSLVVRVARAGETTSGGKDQLLSACPEASILPASAGATGVAGAALAAIDACSLPLGEVARVAYGIKTGDNSAHLAREALTPEHRPALTGAGEVRRHMIIWGGSYLRYGPHLTGYRREHVAVPKIIVQYIRNLSLPQRLVAAVDDAGTYYPLNNFSYITANDGPYDLHFLCALLGSSLLNRVFAARYRDYNIKPAYLRQLPVPRIDFVTPPSVRAALLAEGLALRANELPAFAKARLASGQADVIHDLLAALARLLAAQLRDPARSEDAARSDALIDGVVWQLYGRPAILRGARAEG
ncbi:MAG: hypothetical protein RLZZ387_5454 [Chloroflexota bacterium]